MKIRIALNILMQVTIVLIKIVLFSKEDFVLNIKKIKISKMKVNYTLQKRSLWIKLMLMKRNI